MTTKPEAIVQIEALRAAAVQIQQCDFAGLGNTCNDAADYIAAQDAEIARLREALEDLFGADMEYLLMLDGKDDQIEAIAKAREALTTKGTE